MELSTDTKQLQAIQAQIDDRNAELSKLYAERRRVIRELSKMPGMSKRIIGKLIGVDRRRIYAILDGDN